MPWQLLGGVLAALLLLWLVLLLVLWRMSPGGPAVRDAMRLLPDVLRLVSRLARDRSLPRGVRIRLWLLLGYLALPIDLVPDFLPVIGYADDAVLVLVAVRSVLRAVDRVVLELHWPGTPAGLAAVERLARQPSQ